MGSLVTNSAVDRARQVHNRTRCVGGLLLGQQLQRPVVNQAPAPAPVVVTSCDAYQNVRCPCCV